MDLVTYVVCTYTVLPQLDFDQIKNMKIQNSYFRNWLLVLVSIIMYMNFVYFQGGSYLMYTYSVSGYDVNNKKFSPCSLRFIRKVLLAKSSRCFTEPEESFCGNLRVEGDEECDAGKFIQTRIVPEIIPEIVSETVHTL